eukprot:6390933-Alexandrium_andersonii.AAC.1
MLTHSVALTGGRPECCKCCTRCKRCENCERSNALQTLEALKSLQTAASGVHPLPLGLPEW